ncbi:MAG: hypothetical protein GY870_19325 [archaeon]|nr:hypothetical protein [archaeon]
MKLSNQKKYKDNPRIISDEQKNFLKENLEELGDLSGIIYCVKNKAFVGGNQRSDVFDGSEIEIVERFEKPTKTKTTAHGFINYNGEKYTYREVEFTEKQFQKACITANSTGGDWDTEKLKDWDSVDLEDWGVDVPEIFDGNIDDFFEDAGEQEQKVKEVICPHCGMDINTDVIPYKDEEN